MRICLFIIALLWSCGGDVGQEFYFGKDSREVFFVNGSAENFSVEENILGTFVVEGAADHRKTFNVIKSLDKNFGHYTQNEEAVTVETVNKKVDIVWSIDNSISMSSHQSNLANNFSLFIEDFVKKGIDFKMAIVTTDSAVNRDGNGKLSSSELKKKQAKLCG